MKNKLTICLMAFVFASASTFAQTKETRTVDTFTKIAFRTNGTLYLKQGSPQKVEIEGTKEAISRIQIEVSGGKLTIEHERSDRNWHNEGDIKVYVTVKDIDAIGVHGSGDLVAQTKLTGSSFDISVTGSGSMEAEIEATGKMDANLSGSGNLELKGKFGSFESDLTGSGDISVSATIAEDADFEISGSGKAKVSGTAKTVKASITGSGRILAANLETDKCDVRISGSGDVEINVKSELDANISGSGSVSYRGNPSHVNGHSSGSGHVGKMN
jgi:Putative auto-transporter adhesin, head GIN domain